LNVRQYNYNNLSIDAQKKPIAEAEASYMQKREDTEDKVEELQGNGLMSISLKFFNGFFMEISYKIRYDETGCFISRLSEDTYER